MKHKKIKLPRIVRRRVQQRQEKETDEDLERRYAYYVVEKLGLEISQQREAYQLSLKNKKQSDSWIV